MTEFSTTENNFAVFFMRTNNDPHHPLSHVTFAMVTKAY